MKTPPATATGITQNGSGRRGTLMMEGWKVVETVMEELQESGKGGGEEGEEEEEGLLEKQERELGMGWNDRVNGLLQHNFSM